MTYDELALQRNINMNEIAQRMGLAERVGPIGQSQYELIPLTPSAEKDVHFYAPSAEAGVYNKPDQANLDYCDAMKKRSDDECRFMALLNKIPSSNVAQELYALYRRKGDTLAPNSLETMAQQVGATNPDLYMPYTMASPVNTPLPAVTIIPTPQHPFDAAKEAKVKLAKEAEAKKAAEAAKVKQERDEKVGGAIKRAFR